jgi:hypothetical protein
MPSRFSPLSHVSTQCLLTEDMADKVLGVRGGQPVGKHWAERFVTRSDQLKMAFNRAIDRQRIL